MVRKVMADGQIHRNTCPVSLVFLEEERFVFQANFILHYSILEMQRSSLACVDSLE